MKIITRIRIFFKKLKYNKKQLEKNLKSLSKQDFIQDKQENIINREEYEIIDVSNKLKKFVNLHMLYEEDKYREIRKCDIQEIINLIKRKNETRTNVLRLDSEIVEEFISIIEQEINDEKLDLGELEIDISNKKFKIKKFVEKHNKISYILKFKIISLNDLQEEDFEFLKNRYGIVYIYANEEYHLDELIKIIEKLKEFIPPKSKNDLKSAQEILNIISNKFELYEPQKYELKKKSVLLVNGENLNLPNFKVIENTSYYSSIRNIFVEKKASELGFKRICRETLKLAKFNVIETIESLSNTIKRPDLIIDNINYTIEVTSKRIELVR